MDTLRRNTLPPGYIYDPREGHQVPGDSVLPPASKKIRTEKLAFLEGVSWLMQHLITYKVDVPDITEAVLAEAKKKFPDYD